VNTLPSALRALAPVFSFLFLTRAPLSLHQIKDKMDVSRWNAPADARVALNVTRYRVGSRSLDSPAPLMIRSIPDTVTSSRTIRTETCAYGVTNEVSVMSILSRQASVWKRLRYRYATSRSERLHNRIMQSRDRKFPGRDRVLTMYLRRYQEVASLVIIARDCICDAIAR